MITFDAIRSTLGGSVAAPAAPVALSLDEVPREDPSNVPYVLDEAMATLVNTAIAVDQPLLITGEPGCGKTTLAWAIARQLGTTVESFYVKSTSTARDLLYTVDNLKRFHDASAKIEDARDPAKYVQQGPLWRAFEATDGERFVTRVVLIDEIDKAPRDFPNDLLRELDEKRFEVPEIRDAAGRSLVVRQHVRHVIVITSNGERALSNAFLRRCVYSHLAFPNRERLVKIVGVHAQSRGVPEALIHAAVRQFERLRESGIEKKPATSELLAWVLVLHRRGVSAAALETEVAKLPALELLVKTQDDRERLGAG